MTIGRPNDPAATVGRMRLDINDNTIWNRNEFLEFLVNHQGKLIDLEIPEGADLNTLGVFAILDLFEFKAVTIRTFNLVQEPHKDYQFEIHDLAFRYFTVPYNADYSQYHHWNTNKIFGALYARPTWPRMGLFGQLCSNYKEQSLLNFRFNPHDPDHRQFFDFNTLFEIDPDSVKLFSNVMNQLPMQVEESDGYTTGNTTKGHTDQLAGFYPDFLVDVVAETFLQGRSFYPTEKTTRPMLMKKPFLLMGSKCFLIHLRQMGFKTFWEFWDEEYDGYNMGQRYQKILNIINDLSKKSTAELQQMYQAMQPILEHNYRLLIERSYSKKITYVD